MIRRGTIGWFVIAVGLTMVGATGSASAVIVIGLAPPPAGSTPGCFTGSEAYQGGVASGTDYVVPGPGVIVEWRTQGDSGDSGDLNTFRIYRDNTAVAESRTETLTAGSLNRFATQIPVSGGERIGLATVDGGPNIVSTCGRSATGFAGDFIRYRQPIKPVGDSTPIPMANTAFKLDVAALIEPDADGDGFGDESQDACLGNGGPNGGCPAPDTTAPVTTIATGPKRRTKKTSAAFEFAADEAAATFECALDKAPFAPCTSPVRFGHLKRKKHTFQVRASDAAQNLGTAAVYRWKVKKKRH
jgi:hypothetical protein